MRAWSGSTRVRAALVPAVVLVTAVVSSTPIAAAQRDKPRAQAATSTTTTTTTLPPVTPDDLSVSGCKVRPVPGALESPFGWRRNLFGPGSTFHPGIDLQADWGTPVAVCASGDVVAVGWGGGYGNRVVVQHAGSLSTMYAHLSEITVVEGQRLRAGSHIGFSGATGAVTDPHLHFELRDDGTPVDPIPVLAPVPAQ